MNIDLHTHTACSDGTDTPTELIAKAAAAGLDVVAVTDHDTTAGWAEAARAADRHGIELMCGIEFSTKNAGQSQHLLGYGTDPDHPALVAMLAAGHTSRTGRVPAMVERLADHGIAITVADVERLAGTGTVGRPHVADALIAAGVCASRDEAFETLLAPGCPGYVPRYTPTIEDTIGVINDAGGAAVIAHPWGRKTHVTEERFAELATAGLAGIEVDHQEHDPAARDALRAIAANLDLIVTGSSDHHGLGKVNHDLGCNRTTPDAYAQLVARLRRR